MYNVFFLKDGIVYADENDLGDIEKISTIEGGSQYGEILE
jgi:hypothetical protein